MAEEKPDKTGIDRAKKKFEQCRNEIVETKPSSTNFDGLCGSRVTPVRSERLAINSLLSKDKSVSFLRTGEQLNSKHF